MAVAAARGDKMDSPAGHRLVCVSIDADEGRGGGRRAIMADDKSSRAVIDPPMSTPRGVTNFLNQCRCGTSHPAAPRR